MKRIWKAALLCLVLAAGAGCPEPHHRASSDNPHAQGPQVEEPTGE